MNLFNINQKTNHFKVMFCLLFLLVFSMTFGNPLNKESDIHKEILKYEWTDLYDHEETYEESCYYLFFLLPPRLNNGYFKDSLSDEINIEDNCIFFSISLFFIPTYGVKYTNGIPIKNRDSWEECYETTIDVLRTLHQEYLEMGIIQKKKDL